MNKALIVWLALVFAPLGAVAQQSSPFAGDKPLIIAARSGDEAGARRILLKGGNPNVRNKLWETPLMAAAQGGHTRIVLDLIEAGARLDTRDMNDKNTALGMAVRKNRVDTVRVLLNAGANTGIADKFGTTPLIAAARMGHVAIVNFLLDKRADVSTADYAGLTPLDWARRNNHRLVIARLEQAGAR